ncbi:MAG: SH3 domain-containing protein [Clostridia bacterium]|nr:SH3 domain-containing protein [Clostridia bacterium]
MHINLLCIQDMCPDWYKLEKQTKNTIGKLNSVKDLSFYLKSPDEFIRRLAILRINELKLKDSIEILKDIMDEPYESQPNKELAAWTIKTISHKWNIDLFISHKLLSKFSGTEKLDDIFRLTVKDYSTSIKYEFTSDIIFRELQFDNSSIKQYDEISFEMPFSIIEWTKSYFSHLSATNKKLLANLPLITARALKNFYTVCTKKILIRIFHFIKHNFSTFSRELKHKLSYKKKSKAKTRSLYVHNTRQYPSLKKIVAGLLYVVFTPLRMVIRHKMLFLSAILACYCLLALTVPGKILTYKYTGTDLSEIQSSAYYSAKDFLSFAWNEAKTIIGIEETDTVETTEAEISPLSETGKLYTVTAKEGLNLRMQPDGTSAKVIKHALKHNTKVSFHGQTQKDTSGRLWYLVSTHDGYSGWVNSKWLREAGR